MTIDPFPPMHLAMHRSFVGLEGREVKWGELVIPLLRGTICSTSTPSVGYPASEVLPLGEVLDGLERLRSANAHALLLTVSSGGGQVPAACALWNALRDFSENVGPVVVHVDDAVASTASWWILAADLVLVAPQARVLVHGFTRGGRRGRVLDASDPDYRLIFATYRAHTLADPDALARWLTLHENDNGAPEAVAISADQAVGLAFADYVATRDEAVAVATASAAGVRPPSSRRRLLDARGAVPEFRAELAALRFANPHERTPYVDRR